MYDPILENVHNIVINTFLNDRSLLNRESQQTQKIDNVMLSYIVKNNRRKTNKTLT